jgi:antitoxin ParD1/3/4
MVMPNILSDKPNQTGEGDGMNVSLTPELEEYVASKVRDGLYRSNSEVIRQGLRLLIERDRMLEARVGELRAEVKEGLDQARRGELIPLEEVEKRFVSRARETTG